MSNNYVQDYIDYAATSEENADDTYVMFIDKVKTDFDDVHDQKVADEIAAHEARMAALKAEKTQHYDAISGVRRNRETAARIETAINRGINNQEIIDVEKNIIGEVKRLIHNNDLPPDDDTIYAQLFSPICMANFENDITDKQGYSALIEKLEAHNTEITKKALNSKIQNRFRAMQNEPYGDKFAERVIAGFAEVQDMVENGAAQLNIDVEQCYASALGTFEITNSQRFAARMQRAMQKISAALIFDDIEKFTLDINPAINPALIAQLKEVNFSAQRFEASKLPAKRAEELSALQSDFIDALENGKNFRRTERDMAAIAVELKNSSYVINQPI